MDVQLLLVPYDSAHRGARMGAGPERLVGAGLPARLERAGHQVACAVVEPPAGSWRAEIRTAFEIMRSLASAVRDARAGGRFPLVLAGNCNVAVGVLGGLGPPAGVFWFDAHGDFNTPETTVGGFLDGMALAMVTGRCWSQLSRSVSGFAPVPEEHVCLLGARDLDPLEAAALERSAVQVVPPEAVDSAAAAAAMPGMERAYLHVDLDVLDPSVGRVNEYAAPAGVARVALEAAIAELGRGRSVAAATLSAYDPAHDADGRVCQAAMELTTTLLNAVAAPRATRPAGARSGPPR